MVDVKDLKSHIYIGKNGKAEKYTYPRKGGGNNNRVIPELEREAQYAQLKSQLETISTTHREMISIARELDIDSPISTQVSFESRPDVEMPFESLANATHKIELLNVIKGDSKIIANVMVPDGKLET